MKENYFLYNQDDFIDACNIFQGCLSAIQYIENDRNLEYYYNTLRHIRRTFDVPNDKIRKSFYFRKIPIKS